MSDTTAGRDQRHFVFLLEMGGNEEMDDFM